MHPRTRPAAALAGTLFALTAAIDIAHDQPPQFTSTADYVLEALFAGSLVASAVALALLGSSAERRVARVGWGLTLLGTVTLAVVVTATFLNGEETLDAVFPAGLLSILLGYVVLAAADLAGRVTPRFAGVALFVSGVGMIALGDGYGVVAWAAGWFALTALTAPAVVERQEALR